MAILAAVLAALMLWVQVATLPQDDGPGLPQSRTLTRTEVDARERLLVRGDGQFFAALATDPSMSRPEVLRKDLSGYAYRWVRPLYSWLAWAGSLGRPGAVPSALIALTALSCGVLVAGGARLAETLGRDPRWALACLLIPGTVAILQWTGPEVLASGLALLAISKVIRERRATVPVVVLLVLSVLARETLILICLGLAWLLWASTSSRARTDALAVVLVPGAALAAWLAVIWLRIGASPFDEGGALLTSPLKGVAGAAPSWSSETVTMVVVMALLILGGALRAGTHVGQVMRVVTPTLVFGLALSEQVWGRWEDIGRVLLPACAVLLVAGVPRADRVSSLDDQADLSR